MKQTIRAFLRCIIYLAGIFLVSLGIVLCKKCNLGISPISSIPYVLEELVPLSFGTLTMLFHFVNIALQLILTRKLLAPKILLQIPLAFVFGCVIDWLQELVVFDGTILLYQVLALAGSIFVTALGMVCMINMNLIQNPPDGFVRQLSQQLQTELGTVKIVYDCSCVVIATVLGLVLLGRAKGLGVATVFSMLLVGRTVTWLQTMKIKLKRPRKAQL
ncbi:MAG: DUF6198 family protein [Clostridiales bacterium]|nr:DUF6198 family protein [Clostridiales bacterium]